jgi:hypothetical protein
MRAVENRRIAEEKAGVTKEQSAKLDQAFEKVYSDVLDYTNKAITDGQLSPYERNVAGWLDYAGGLGGVLGIAGALLMSFTKISMMNFATWQEITFSFDPNPKVLLTALVCGCVMGILGGFFPAIRAARVAPVEALRA